MLDLHFLGLSFRFPAARTRLGSTSGTMLAKVERPEPALPQTKLPVQAKTEMSEPALRKCP